MFNSLKLIRIIPYLDEMCVSFSFVFFFFFRLSHIFICMRQIFQAKKKKCYESQKKQKKTKLKKIKQINTYTWWFFLSPLLSFVDCETISHSYGIFDGTWSAWGGRLIRIVHITAQWHSKEPFKTDHCYHWHIQRNRHRKRAFNIKCHKMILSTRTSKWSMEHQKLSWE